MNLKYAFGDNGPEREKNATAPIAICRRCKKEKEATRSMEAPEKKRKVQSTYSSSNWSFRRFSGRSTNFDLEIARSESHPWQTYYHFSLDSSKYTHKHTHTHLVYLLMHAPLAHTFNQISLSLCMCMCVFAVYALLVHAAAALTLFSHLITTISRCNLFL